MNIDWVHLVAAIALLWLPRKLLRAGRRLHAGGRHRHHGTDVNAAQLHATGEVSFRLEIAKLRNTIDLLRGALGSVLLVGGFAVIEPAVTAAEEAPAEVARLAAFVPVGVLLVAVLIQMLRFEHRLRLFPPLFFLAGLSVGLCGPTAALFALVLVWTINMALPGPASFLSLHAVLLVLFGLFFRGLGDRLPLLAGALTFLPVLLSLLLQRPLALFAKRVKSPLTAEAS